MLLGRPPVKMGIGVRSRGPRGALSPHSETPVWHTRSDRPALLVALSQTDPLDRDRLSIRRCSLDRVVLILFAVMGARSRPAPGIVQLAVRVIAVVGFGPISGGSFRLGRPGIFDSCMPLVAIRVPVCWPGFCLACTASWRHPRLSLVPGNCLAAQSPRATRLQDAWLGTILVPMTLLARAPLSCYVSGVPRIVSGGRCSRRRPGGRNDSRHRRLSGGISWIDALVLSSSGAILVVHTPVLTAAIPK